MECSLIEEAACACACVCACTRGHGCAVGKARQQAMDVPDWRETESSVEIEEQQHYTAV
jgi:hypothetical protein